MVKRPNGKNDDELIRQEKDERKILDKNILESKQKIGLVIKDFETKYKIDSNQDKDEKKEKKPTEKGLVVTK